MFFVDDKRVAVQSANSNTASPRWKKGTDLFSRFAVGKRIIQVVQTHTVEEAPQGNTRQMFSKEPALHFSLP